MDVLELNYRCRTGEIDIIARDGGYLVFVEVKYRKTKRAGYALEAIDSRKAGQVRRVAAVYLYEHGFPESAACRFDAGGDRRRADHTFKKCVLDGRDIHV